MNYKGKKTLIVGSGCGRCGTLSLATLLDAQPDSTITHESGIPLPWEKSYIHFKLYVERIYNTYPGFFVGDIAFYTLNYTEYFFKMFPNVKFVCLKRNKEDVVKSFIKMVNLHNTSNVNIINGEHWNALWRTKSQGITFWRHCLPKYDLPLKEAWEKYYDDYYNIATDLEIKYSNFKIWDI